MTLDREINHSLSEKEIIRVKASHLFNHISSVDLFGFDRLQTVIIYLFFYYLMVKDKNNEEINTEITKLMIDKKVLTKESARKLVDRNKLHINNKEILE